MGLLSPHTKHTEPPGGSYSNGNGANDIPRLGLAQFTNQAATQGPDKELIAQIRQAFRDEFALHRQREAAAQAAGGWLARLWRRVTKLIGGQR